MKQFRYKVYTLVTDGENADRSLEVLNEHGQNGWYVLQKLDSRQGYVRLLLSRIIITSPYMPESE